MWQNISPQAEREGQCQISAFVCHCLLLWHCGNRPGRQWTSIRKSRGMGRKWSLGTHEKLPCCIVLLWFWESCMHCWWVTGSQTMWVWLHLREAVKYYKAPETSWCLFQSFRAKRRWPTFTSFHKPQCSFIPALLNWWVCKLCYLLW